MSVENGVSPAPTFSGESPAVRYSLAASCAGLAGYIVFHSIPGTGAVRSLFLLLLLGGLLNFSRLARPALRWPPFDLAGMMLVLLSAWLAIQSGFLAVDGPETLRTFAEEWPKNLLIACLGIWLARAALFAQKAEWVLAATFCGFFTHVVGTLEFQAWHLAAHGEPLFNMSVFGNHGYVSPLVDGAIAIALADAAGRLCRKHPLLSVSSRDLAGLCFLALVSLVALGSKSSSLNMLLMITLLVAVTAIHGRRYRMQILVLTLAAALGVVALGTLVQGRWSGAMESIRYGMAVEQHTSWMRTDDPILGEPLRVPGRINESFYLRAAWGTVALRGLAEHPLGRGYGSNGFGRLLGEKYGMQGAVSSHSGWLDFALANGIPGLVLLLAFSAALCVRGWRAFVDQTGTGGLALAFLTIAYIARCLFDGQISTSKLMAFFLVSGVMWGLSWNADPGRESRPA